MMQKITALFLKLGTRNVSMDDIAENVGVSKRTLYLFFNNKHTVVHKVVSELIRTNEDIITTTRLEAIDVIDEALQQDVALVLICRNIRPKFFMDLEKCYPEVWEELEEYKLKFQKNIIDNLHKGKQDGFYRPDVDVMIVAELRLQQLVNIRKPELVKDTTLLYLHSVTTPKGKKLLDKYAKKKENSWAFIPGKINKNQKRDL